MEQTVSLTQLGEFVKETLLGGKSVEMVVTGNSMFPLFVNKRDTVKISPVKKLKKRQICFYQTIDGQFMLHRIVKLSDNGVFFVGDNRIVIEKELPKERVYGVVTEYVRRGKRKSVKCLFHKIYSFIWCVNIKARPRLLKFLLKFKGKK